MGNWRKGDVFEVYIYTTAKAGGLITSDLRFPISDFENPHTFSARRSPYGRRRETSNLKPQTSDLKPQTSNLRPQTSNLVSHMIMVQKRLILLDHLAALLSALAGVDGIGRGMHYVVDHPLEGRGSYVQTRVG